MVFVVALSAYVRLIATAVTSPTRRPVPTAARKRSVARPSRLVASRATVAPVTSAAVMTPGSAYAERLIAVTPAAVEWIASRVDQSMAASHPIETRASTSAPGANSGRPAATTSSVFASPTDGSTASG